MAPTTTDAAPRSRPALAFLLRHGVLILWLSIQVGTAVLVSLSPWNSALTVPLFCCTLLLVPLLPAVLAVALVAAKQAMAAGRAREAGLLVAAGAVPWGASRLLLGEHLETLTWVLWAPMSMTFLLVLFVALLLERRAAGQGFLGSLQLRSATLTGLVLGLSGVLGAAHYFDSEGQAEAHYVARFGPLVVAIDAFASDHGALPTSLDELVPDYVDELPARARSAFWPGGPGQLELLDYGQGDYRLELRHGVEFLGPSTLVYNSEVRTWTNGD